MTLDLVFHGANPATATLDLLAREVGVGVDIVGLRTTGMEIFSATVVTVRLAGSPTAMDAAGAWIARRGIHRLAA